MAVRGVITSRAFFSENSNTPSISAASCRSITPPSWLCSTRMRNSSAEWTFSSALPGRRPNGFNTSSAERLSTHVNGIVIQAKATRPGTSQRATRSGLLMVAPRGASSPNTTWKYVTTDSAHSVPSPTAPIFAGNGSTRSACENTADSVSSASAPMPMLARVIPNWLAESRRARLALAFSTSRAFVSPPRAIASSRERRERTTENSAATKKPFKASNPRMASMRPSTR